jgi:hypothetical protein
MEVGNGAMADRRHFTIGCSCPPLDASGYGHHLALVSLCLGDAVTPVDAKLSPKNMRGELAQARPVTFSVAATAAGTRIKLAWRETGSVPAHRPSDPGDLSRLGGPNSIDLK